MADDAEELGLLRQISNISGRHKNQPKTYSYRQGKINRHKYSATNSITRSQSPTWNKYVSSSVAKPGQQITQVTSKSAAPTHARHRTLVLNHTPSSANNGSKNDSQKEPSDRWVVRRDRHMQIINSGIYEHEAQARTKAVEASRAKKAKDRNMQEKQRLQDFLAESREPAARAAPSHCLTLDGLSYEFQHNGEKLTRIYGIDDSTIPTPKTLTIAGVNFQRSRNGNLYRAGLVHASRTFGGGIRSAKKVNQLCKAFTSTGKCQRGSRCAYTHDPAKVAICRSFLHTGHCSLGSSCDLSHEPDATRVPACVHYQQDPTTPVCEAFARLGYCHKGKQCSKRHVTECPEYANEGKCNDTRCSLPHVDRAGQLRKDTKPGLEHAVIAKTDVDQRADEHAPAEEGSDQGPLVSDDVDSDGMEDLWQQERKANESPAVFEQHDYVEL